MYRYNRIYLGHFAFFLPNSWWKALRKGATSGYRRAPKPDSVTSETWFTTRTRTAFRQLEKRKNFDSSKTAIISWHVQTLGKYQTLDRRVTLFGSIYGGSKPFALESHSLPPPFIPSHLELNRTNSPLALSTVLWETDVLEEDFVTDYWKSDTFLTKKTVHQYR